MNKEKNQKPWKGNKNARGHTGGGTLFTQSEDLRSKLICTTNLRQVFAHSYAHIQIFLDKYQRKGLHFSSVF